MLKHPINRPRLYLNKKCEVHGSIIINKFLKLIQKEPKCNLCTFTQNVFSRYLKVALRNMT